MKQMNSPRNSRGNAHVFKMLIIIGIVIGFLYFFFTHLTREEKPYVVADSDSKNIKYMTSEEIESSLKKDNCWYQSSTGYNHSFNNIYLCLNKERVVKTQYASPERNLRSTSSNLDLAELQYISTMIAAPYSEYFCQQKPEFFGCKNPKKALITIEMRNK